MTLRPHAVYAAVAATACLVYPLIPAASSAKLPMYHGVGVIAVIATAVGIRRNRPANARAWWLILADVSLFCTADIVYEAMAAFSGEVPFPSVPDVFYLSTYPLLSPSGPT